MGSRWANKTYVTMNCPSSDADVKSELDVQVLVSLPFYSNKLSRMYGGIHCNRHPGQSYARDVVNTSISRT